MDYEEQEMDYEGDFEGHHGQSDRVESTDDDNYCVIAPPYSPISNMDEDVD